MVADNQGAKRRNEINCVITKYYGNQNLTRFRDRPASVEATYSGHKIAQQPKRPVFRPAQLLQLIVGQRLRPKVGIPPDNEAIKVQPFGRCFLVRRLRR